MSLVFTRTSTETWLLFCTSPAIPGLAGIWAFRLPYRCQHCCSTANMLSLSPFHVGFHAVLMCWLCTSAALLIWRQMFTATYRPLLFVLLMLLRYRGLWPCER